MANEMLPIKLFAKRDIDNFRVEPIGNTPDYDWLFSGEELTKHSESFVAKVNDFKKRLDVKEKSNSIVPLIFKAKIRNDTIAKTHRREIRDLFEIRGKNNVLGLAESDELLIKIDKPSEALNISKKIKQSEKNRYALSCIDSLYEYSPKIEISQNETDDYKVKLIDFQDYEQNNSIRNLFERSVENIKANIVRTNYTKDLVIYNLKNIKSSVLDSLKSEEIFEAVLSIEPMPKYVVTMDAIPTESTISMLHPENNARYTTVGFLDNGIASIPHLKPWLIKDNWTSYPKSVINPFHGTFVAGVALYGDSFEKSDWVGCKGFKIFDATVFPDTNKEAIKEDELINNIQEAIQAKYSEIKIWNLSISIANPIDTDDFSDFAMALDAVQDQYNVLICKSAGNCYNFITGHPKGRILQGADSVRSLVVGSIAHKKSRFDLVDIDNPSPFSRIGPGPSFIIKPEVSQYGGNAGKNKDGQMVTSGVTSFSADGAISTAAGTSFSTPRITALVAGIYQELDEEFDPLLLKCMVIHSASYSSKLTIPEKERTRYLGFGKPANVTHILYNDPNEVTLILLDNLPKGEYIDILDFPMPDCLIQEGYYTGQIIVTLVYNPILVPSQRSEYCQSNIAIQLGTYDDKKDRDTTKRNILNPIGREGAKNILLESVYSKNRMRSNPHEFALKERLLIKYADKYYPVKKYGIDLFDFSETNKIKFLGANKHWFLWLKGLFRDFSVNNATLNSQELSQDFCLMVTIKDPSKTKPVYDGVTQKLDEYNFWHNNIKLRSEVKYKV